MTQCSSHTWKRSENCFYVSQGTNLFIAFFFLLSALRINLVLYWRRVDSHQGKFFPFRYYEGISLCWLCSKLFSVFFFSFSCCGEMNLRYFLPGIHLKGGRVDCDKAKLFQGGVGVYWLNVFERQFFFFRTFIFFFFHSAPLINQVVNWDWREFCVVYWVCDWRDIFFMLLFFYVIASRISSVNTR